MEMTKRRMTMQKFMISKTYSEGYKTHSVTVFYNVPGYLMAQFICKLCNFVYGSEGVYYYFKEVN